MFYSCPGCSYIYKGASWGIACACFFSQEATALNRRDMVNAGKISTTISDTIICTYIPKPPGKPNIPPRSTTDARLAHANVQSILAIKRHTFLALLPICIPFCCVLWSYYTTTKMGLEYPTYCGR